MALFGSKKKVVKKKDTSEKVKQVSSVRATVSRDLSSVLVKPRITEKAVTASERNVYVFEVRSDANKFDIRDAVKEIFGVTPVKVRTVTSQPRQSLSRARGRKVAVKGLKKAYIYLKDGDSISLV